MKKVLLFVAAALGTAHLLFPQENKSDSLQMVRLQEVEIVSVRAEEATPVAHAEMDKRLIETYNAGRDIPFLLTLTPSVVATSDAGTGIGYTGFRVRGTDANRINVTANGVPLNDSESHGVFWVNMPDLAASLQDLQVQRGVGTSTHGAGAFGASVNMTTEAVSNRPYAEAHAGYGAFRTAKAAVKAGSGLLDNRFAVDTRLSTIASDGFTDRAAVNLGSYFVQGVWLGDNRRVKLITFGGNEKTYHAWDGVPAEILADGHRSYNPSGYRGDDPDGRPLYYRDQTDNYRQTHYQLSWLQGLGAGKQLNVTLHYTRGAGYDEE
jgi:iron complex outermembrane receptor protein